MLKRRTWIGGGLMLALVTCASYGLLAQGPARPAAPPGAPSGVTYLVNGGTVSLFWTHATGAFTHYIIEAGAAPGQTFFSFPTSSIVDGPPDAATFPKFLSAFGTAGVSPGNYYVRVRGVNGAEQGPATNDVLVPVTTGCQPPGVPRDLYAVIRASSGWLQWSPGSGGNPTQFTLIARSSPGGPTITVFPTTNLFLNVGGIPAGNYFVSVLAQNACGQSAASPEITVTAPSSSPARSPNPIDGGRLTAQYVQDIVQQFSQQNPGLLQASCPNPNSKYGLNPFLNGLVDRLRQIDQRWGYNSKPTRGPARADAPEGSPNVALIDVISGHCGPNPGLDYRVFTNREFGRFTGAGRF
ncbi:MAG: fibronectin type III domain-containing protein [Acidobacteria bacterium]|nr:fibronectin type III domain-containing protein [Acidobacteriota bacterium]